MKFKIFQARCHERMETAYGTDLSVHSVFDRDACEVSLLKAILAQVRKLHREPVEVDR